MSWSPSDIAWARRFPGAHKGPVFAGRPCLICKRPGYTVMAPADELTTEMTDITEKPQRLETLDTCPGHEYAVRRFLARDYAPLFYQRVEREAVSR